MSRTIKSEEQRRFSLVKSEYKIDQQLVCAQTSMLGAIKLCISAGGFDADKQVYVEIGIDAGHWTRVMHGEAHFPVNKLPALMELCGNDAPLLWLVNDRGYDLHSLRKKETETEKENRELREEVGALRRALAGAMASAK